MKTPQIVNGYGIIATGLPGGEAYRVEAVSKTSSGWRHCHIAWAATQEEAFKIANSLDRA